MGASCWLKWLCSSSSTKCQSISRFGPSKNPSRDTDIMRTTFLICRGLPWGGVSRAVDHQGDRAVVHQVHLHVLLEGALGHSTAQRLQGLSELLDPPRRLLGRRGGRPRRPPALAGVTV